MAFPEDGVTCPAPPAVKNARGGRVSVLAALGLVLGSAICTPAVRAQSSPILAGKWQLSCAGRRGQSRQISLDIEQHGTTLSGSYAASRQSGQLQGSVQGNQVSFRFAGPRRSASFTGTTDGKALQVHTAKGIACTGTRR
jgi:hypothetical protein